MAKGRDKYEARRQALLKLGTPLSRRSGSRCELCSAAGTSLRPTEVAPEASEPSYERCILICDRCHHAVVGGQAEAREWRFLEEVAWTDLVPLQVTAVRMLRRFSNEASWASALLESLYLAPETEAWLNQDD